MNLFSAVPPAPWIHKFLPYTGPITVLGSIAMLAITMVTLWLLAHAPGRGRYASRSRARIATQYQCR